MSMATMKVLKYHRRERSIVFASFCIFGSASDKTLKYKAWVGNCSHHWSKIFSTRVGVVRLKTEGDRVRLPAAFFSHFEVYPRMPTRTGLPLHNRIASTAGGRTSVPSHLA